MPLTYPDNKSKLELVVSLIKDTKYVCLGGSLNLMCRGLIPERKASDIDIVTNDFESWEDRIYKFVKKEKRYTVRASKKVIYDCGNGVLRQGYEIIDNYKHIVHELCMFFNIITIEKISLNDQTIINMCSVNDVIASKEYLISKVDKHVNDLEFIRLNSSKDGIIEPSIVELM